MPSVSLWAYSAEKLFLISRLSRSAERSKRYFHGRGRNGKRHLQRRFLRKRGAADSGLALSGRFASRFPFLSLRDIFPRRGGSLSSQGEPLAWRQSFQVDRKACGCACSPGGAVAQRLRGYKWRSEKSVKAIAPTGAALAFLCFDFFFRIVKGVQPLTRCGVGGVQR